MRMGTFSAGTLDSRLRGNDDLVDGAFPINKGFVRSNVPTIGMRLVKQSCRSPCVIHVKHIIVNTGIQGILGGLTLSKFGYPTLCCFTNSSFTVTPSPGRSGISICPFSTGNDSCARSCSIGLAPREYSRINAFGAAAAILQAGGKHERPAP